MGVAKARRDMLDLMACDLGLPGGGGRDVMRRVQEKFAGRAIAPTAYGMDSDIMESNLAGPPNTSRSRLTSRSSKQP